MSIVLEAGTRPGKRDAIIAQVKRAEALLAGGATLPQVAEALNVKYHTLYARLRRYAVLEQAPTARIAALEKINAELRGALAELDPNFARRRKRTAKRSPNGETP